MPGQACLPGGPVCLEGMHGIHPPPGTEFLTHVGENITFLQLLLRAIKIFVISVKELEPAFSCVGDQDATRASARHM